MKRDIKTFLIWIILLIVSGCASSDVYVPSETDIVFINDEVDIENENILIEFIKNTETGKRDSIRVVSYSQEAVPEPILTDLVFYGEELEVTVDYSRLEYADNDDISIVKCEKVKLEGKIYEVIGCDGYVDRYFLAERKYWRIID